MTEAGKTFLLLVYSVVVIGQQSQLLSLAASPTSHAITTTTTNNNDDNHHQSQEQQQHTYASEDKAAIDTFEATLLGLFGMKSRPRPNSKVHIPAYMYELYRQHTGTNPVVSTDSQARGSRPLFSANTIRSFYDDSSDEPHAGSAEEYNRAGTLVFNVSSLKDTETLKGAELRVHRLQANGTQRQDLPDEAVQSLASQHHRIDIYEILKPATRTREAIMRLVDTRTVQPHRTRWESFDISPIAERWRSQPHLNHGLHVLFSTRTGEPSQLRHVRLKRSVSVPEEDWHSHKPILVTYSDDGTDAVSASRARRSSSKRKNKKREARRKKRKRQLCRRRKLYVDFGKVGWNDWIVAPPGYNAFYCNGACPSVLADTMNSTNHAIVQSFVHAVNPEAVPKPCCVPTELSSISMLYINENEKVELKKYNDMVVQACGCR